jgi:hypothetical protein
MDTVKDNKKVNFPITKLTIGVAALGVAGGVFFGAFLATQGVTETVSSSEQSLVVSDSLKNDITTNLNNEVEASEVEASASTTLSTALDIHGTTWGPGDSIPKGYFTIGNTIVNNEAVTFNPDGTMSWDARFSVPAGHVVVDGLLYPDEFAPNATKDRTPKPTPTAEQTLKNETGQAEIKPAPAQDKPREETPKPSEESNPLPNPGDYCPGYREENPSLYDSCHAGFVAPTIEWAGYHSCRKTPDGNVQIFGKVRLVGGNYNVNDYGWDTHVISGLGIVNSVNASSPYFVSWVAGAWFGAMDGFNKGIIAKVHGSGVNKIDESLLDPSCHL